MNGSPLLNEIQRVVVQASGGTFKVRHDTEAWSSATNWPASTAAWQDALDETAGDGNTIATGLGTPSSPLSVEFVGDFETTEVPLLRVDTSLLTGNATIGVQLARDPVTGLHAIQRVIVDPNASGGSIRLGRNGRFSGAIAWNANASAVDTSLEAVPGIGAGNLTVEGQAGSPWIISFVNDLAFTPIELLTIDQDGLIVTGIGVMAVEEENAGAGPNFWATAGNWTLGRVPNTHDVVDLGPGRSDILAGLVQRAPVIIKFPDDPEEPQETDLLDTDGLADFVDGQVLRMKSSSGEFPTASVDGESVTIDGEVDLYVLSASRIDRNLQLALAREGLPIVWSSIPNGTLYLQVELLLLRHQMAYTGKIGLPPRDDSGRFEDKPKSLRIGFLPSRLEQPNLQLGVGEGSGSTRLNLDAGVSPVRAEIINSGGSVGDYPPVLFDGTNDENQFLQIQGEVGLSVLSGTTTRFRRIQLIGGRLVLGTDVHAADGAEIEVYGAGQFLAGDLVTRRANIRIRGQ